MFELQKTELKNNRILSNNTTVNWVSTLTMPSYFFKNKINIELIEKQRNASNLFPYDRNHLNLSLKLTKFWRLILTKKNRFCTLSTSLQKEIARFTATCRYQNEILTKDFCVPQQNTEKKNS